MLCRILYDFYWDIKFEFIIIWCGNWLWANFGYIMNLWKFQSLQRWKFSQYDKKDIIIELLPGYFNNLKKK